MRGGWNFDVLPAAATFSKDPRAWGGKDWFPESLTRGHGAMVRSRTGRAYLDWVSGLGANLLGHADPQFVEHLTRALRLGTAFSLPHGSERVVANMLCLFLATRIPGWGKVNLGMRWGKTGSDVLDMAVRLARAATGRATIARARGSYHGWHDWGMAGVPPAHGVLVPRGNNYEPATVWFEFGDIESMEGAWSVPLAAVVIEHPLHDPGSDFYASVRSRCDSTGTLLIMDEVVTGFRYAEAGAAQRSSITPDLACYGKALGNGISVSALVGKRDLLDWFGRDDPVFCSSTGFGDLLGFAAADHVLDRVGRGGLIEHLWDVGAQLMSGLKEAGCSVTGHPPRSLIEFESEAQRGHFIASMRDRGILINRPNFPTLAHSIEDVERTVEVARAVVKHWNSLSGEARDRWAARAPRRLFAER